MWEQTAVHSTQANAAHAQIASLNMATLQDMQDYATMRSLPTIHRAWPDTWNHSRRPETHHFCTGHKQCTVHMTSSADRHTLKLASSSCQTMQQAHVQQPFRITRQRKPCLTRAAAVAAGSHCTGWASHPAAVRLSAHWPPGSAPQTACFCPSP